MTTGETTRRTKRIRRDKRRERNRENLIAATLDLIREVGVGGVTVAAVARRANMHAPGFYAHFPDITSCIRTVAEEIAHSVSHVHLRMLEEQGAIDLEETPEGAAKRVRKHWAAFTDDRRVGELVIQHLTDPSPIGDTIRSQKAIYLQAYARQLWMLGQRAGVEGEDLAPYVQLAEHVMTVVDAGLVKVLRDPETDVEALAKNAGETVHDVVTGAIRRRLKQQQDDSVASVG